jgi:hypothetical protein
MSWENGIKTVYNLHTVAIGRQFPPSWLHFSLTEVLAPDIESSLATTTQRAHIYINNNIKQKGMFRF